MFGFFRLSKELHISFEEIYEENFKLIYSFVYSRTGGNQEAAEDILQETFMVAYKKLGSFRGESSIKTWLYAIAKNKLMEFYRKEAKLLKLNNFEQIENFVSITEGIEQEFLELEEKKMVFEVLKRLKAINRYVLIMKYLDEYSVKAIAKVLGKTPKAVDGILQRARAEFRAEYSKMIGEEAYEARG